MPQLAGYCRQDPDTQPHYLHPRYVSSIKRRASLIAKKSGNDSQLRWNIVMQGPDENVFFDC